MTPDTPPKQHRLSKGMLIFMIIPLLGLVVAVLMLVAEESTRGQTAVSPTGIVPVPGIMNQPAPDFSVQNLDGQTVRLEDYRGRVVFLNFWATWCPPCVKELPALERFAAAQGDDGAVVLASNNTETAEQIQTYLQENDITLDHVPVLLDADSAVYRLFGVVRLPTTWIIDREGVIRAVKFGEFDDATLQAYYDEAAQY